MILSTPLQCASSQWLIINTARADCTAGVSLSLFKQKHLTGLFLFHDYIFSFIADTALTWWGLCGCVASTRTSVGWGICTTAPSRNPEPTGGTPRSQRCRIWCCQKKETPPVSDPLLFSAGWVLPCEEMAQKERISKIRTKHCDSVVQCALQRSLNSQRMVKKNAAAFK